MDPLELVLALSATLEYSLILTASLTLTDYRHQLRLPDRCPRLAKISENCSVSDSASTNFIESNIDSGKCFIY